MKTTSKLIKTYRYVNDLGTEGLEAAIGRVLEHVQEATGRLPSIIIVPRIKVTEAQQVIDKVVKRFAKAGLTVEITIRPVGGCLVGEVWWEEE
jgi:NAD/NADP transhydrogenase beta subunit